MRRIADTIPSASTSTFGRPSASRSSLLYATIVRSAIADPAIDLAARLSRRSAPGCPLPAARRQRPGDIMERHRLQDRRQNAASANRLHVFSIPMTSLLPSPVRRILVAISLMATTWAGAAPPAQPDAKGGQDSTLIRRFAGSWLTGYKVSDWDQAAFPTGAEVKDRKWSAPLVVEGRLTRVFYVAPVGKSPLEVHRNYEQALVAAGFKRRFACEANCSDLYFAMDKSLDYANGTTWSTGDLVSVSGGRYSVTSGALSSEQGRMLYGVLPRGGQDVHVLLYTSVAENGTTNAAATFIQIVEPKAMPTGQVVVDAKTLQQDLKSAGKVALYGLYFDTGRAEIKPESKPQLEEMAKLLQSQPELRVYVVGHTDNQGTLDGNVQLSQQRAAAVVAALTSGYKVDSKRLVARGVANLAPVANNQAEEGRSRNRRVELVPQ